MRTLIFSLLLLLLPGLAEAAPSQTIRRFALIAASEEGGSGRVPLRYARSDAQAFSKVLRELGGVSAADTVVLLDSNRAALQAGIRDLEGRLTAAKKEAGRLELLVYYSGHSDEKGLLLGEDTFTYAELRKQLETLPADVRIAILDSCASGALTRSKGGMQRAPFLVDASAKVKGHAFLTSSSADEVSQESDAIAASFFTYFLVSGLRGAADFNHDGRVTLNEAYQFAFQETLARTEKTRGGAQHAAYDIALSGAGDLVLTDLRQTSAALVLAEELRGRVFIRDASGRLVVELNKFPGRAVDLGLEPGRYRIVLERDRKLFEAFADLQQGKPAKLAEGHLTPIEGELTAMRGAVTEATFETSTAVSTVRPAKTYKVIPASFLILPRVSTEGLEGADELNYFSYNFIAGHGARLDGAEIAVGINSRSDEINGAQVGVIGNFAGMGWWSNPYAWGDVRGAQLAVGFNAARGNVQGMQVAEGANITGGKVQGAQLAVGANLASAVDGAQIAVGFNGTGSEFQVVGAPLTENSAGLQVAVGANVASGGLNYAQAAVGANIAVHDARYAQLAVGANFAQSDARFLQSAVGANFTGGDFYGMQSAVGVNVTRHTVYGHQNAVGGNYAYDVKGVQFAQGVNYAHRLTGVQAATINVAAGPTTGFQAGLVNVAGKARGLQLGLINYSEDMTGAAIGLLSYSRRFPLRYQVWADDVNLANVGVKIHGSKYIYNVLSAGGQPMGGLKRYSLGWGIGGHVPIRNLYIDFDGMLQSLRFEGDAASVYVLGQVRTVIGWHVTERFAVYAGPTYNTYVSHDGGPNAARNVTIFGTSREYDGKFRGREWKGVMAGVEF